MNVGRSYAQLNGRFVRKADKGDIRGQVCGTMVVKPEAPRKVPSASYAPQGP